MIHKILVGLDGSQATTDLAVGWAKRFGAELTGVAVVDDVPDLKLSPYGNYKSFKLQAYLERIARIKTGARKFRDEFEARCTAEGVPFTVSVVTGDPVEVFLARHDSHDVTLLPKEPRFRFATEDGPDDSLVEILRHARKPVVAVPEVVPVADGVLVAYDGSPAAVDALESFAVSGLGTDRPVSVVSADMDKNEAERRADEAARYLASHDVRATPKPLATGADDADTLATAAEYSDAGMIVMGAFSRGRLREWFRPSVTARMLARPEQVLYLHHHMN